MSFADLSMNYNYNNFNNTKPTEGNFNMMNAPGMNMMNATYPYPVSKIKIN